MTIEGVVPTPTIGRTFAASILAVILVAPASIAGAAVRWLSVAMINLFYGGGSWIPFIDQFGYVWFPNFLLGAVSGLIAVGLTAWIVKRANLMTVAVVVSVVWAALYIASIVLKVSVEGYDLQVTQAIAILIGIAIGSFSGAKENG